MKETTPKWHIFFLCFLCIGIIFIIPILYCRTATAVSANTVIYPCVIIDAGHGGIDGGAISCTGVYESHINLQISQRLCDIFHLIGIQTKMIRNTDTSVYTEGESIAAKKISDLKERVRIANNTPGAIYLSVHQNSYPNAVYHGAQVFYNKQSGSKELAETIQFGLRNHLNPDNKRQCKQTSGIYLMEHINCCGVLIECGFLSNPTEEAKLRDEAYQKQVACVIATCTSQYLNT